MGAAREVCAVHGAVDVGEAQHGEEAQDVVIVLGERVDGLGYK